MSIKTVLAVGGAALALASGIAFWRTSTKPKAHQFVMRAPTEERVRATLTAEARSLPLPAALLVSPAVDLPAPTSTAEQPREPAPTESSPSEQEVVQRQLDSLDAEFTGQELDRNWAREASSTLDSTLHERLRDIAADTSIAPMDCRGSLCRTELSYAEARQQHVVIDRVFGQPGLWQGEVMGLTARDEAHQTTRTVLYFARQGTAFHNLVD